jgi:multidrug efflux pump subunit AcrA (membrane-fusion protein)
MSSREVKKIAVRTIGAALLLAGAMTAASRLRTASAAVGLGIEDTANFVTAISYPSEKSQPPFYAPGIIDSIPVKEGDRVHKGDLLMTEDMALEKDELQALKVESESTKTVEYAIAEHQAKLVERDRLEAAAAKGVANPSELAEAVAEETATAVRIDLAKEENQKSKFETQKQADKVARMELHSPIDGIVQTLNLHLGSGVDPSKPDGACVIVNNDPLWVEMRLPSIQAAALKLQQKLDVRYLQNDPWQQGTIIYFNPVVDAASDTQVVRLELANPDQRPSGLHMTVRLPGDVAKLAVNH